MPDLVSPSALHARERLDELLARCLAGKAPRVVPDIESQALWEVITSRAWQTQVGSVLLHELERQEIALPASAERQLRAYREHVAEANAYQLAGAEPVLARLQEDGVAFLVLKGAALGAALYDAPGLRPMVDIDVLVRAGDVERADRALRSAGCVPGAELVRADFFPRYHYEREYFTADIPRVKLDLHVRPFRPLRYARTVPASALWAESSSAAFGRLQVMIPGPESMLIHLAVHAACHGLSELRWLEDVRRWLDRFAPQIDIARVARTCRQWRLALPMERCLRKIMHVYGDDSTPLRRLLAAVAARSTWLDRLTLRQAPRGAERPAMDVLVNTLCAPGLRFRAGYLRAVLLPDTDHLGQLYPRRHPGWRAAAHIHRAVRHLVKPFHAASTADA